VCGLLDLDLSGPSRMHECGGLLVDGMLDVGNDGQAWAVLKQPKDRMGVVSAEKRVAGTVWCFGVQSKSIHTQYVPVDLRWQRLVSSLA
jgi:hypothetical protein